ncbi:MAG: zinc-binding dehydrogenase [Anaerolineaceae bacterium]|nr:zinc-binding dehydrogenase [Anaerolineaceae bacterium]
MKVVRLHAAGDLQYHTEEKPVEIPGDAIIRIGAVGICGSDLHWFDDAGIGDARLERPLILGHEMAGFAETGKYAGQMVAIDPSVPCGNCDFCKEGNPNFCPTQRFAGHAEEDGAMREYMVWPEECLFPLPEGFSCADGVMLEPLGVAIYAVDLSGIKSGDTVGVFGCGPIGLLIIQLARQAGAGQIIATDILAHRLEAAKKLGADQVFLADQMQEVEVIRQVIDAKGLDVVIEVAGDNEAVEAALALVKPGGKVTLVGIPSDNRTSVDAATVRRKGLALQWVRRMKHTYPRAIQLVQSGKIDVGSLISGHFSFDQVNQAFETAQKREGLKIILSINEGSESVR